MNSAPRSRSSGLSVGGISASARSLNDILLAQVGLVVGGGLALYTGFEWAFDPPDDWLNFLTHHFGHVVGVGLAVWWVCWLVLRKNVLAPLATIASYLARLRRGRMERLECATGAAEVEAIVNGINQLVDGLQVVGSDDLTTALTSVQELRVRLKGLAVEEPDLKLPVMQALTKLESSLLNLLVRDH